MTRGGNGPAKDLRMITRSNIISIFRHFSLGEHVISRLLGHVAGRVIKKTKGGEVA